MNIVETIANTGGVLGLAIFAIWMMNKVWEDRLKKQEIVNDELREMRARSQACVEESSKVIAANTEVLRANTEVMRANTEAMQANTEATNTNREVTRQLLRLLRSREREGDGLQAEPG